MAVKQKILVTGGTGFIGAALVRRLLKAGRQVRVLDNNSRGAVRRLTDVRSDFELVEADIRDRDAIFRALAGMESVVHLAYVNGTEFFYSAPETVLDVAIKGMMNVVDGCIHHGIGDFVLASSSEVYQTPACIPTDETVPLIVPDPLNPRYSYGGGKIACELMAVNYGRKYFDRTVIFRPHNVYGPDMGWEHVLPQFALRMRKICKAGGENPVKFPIQGTGKETRAFIYIDDFADGLMTVLARGENLGIYHIGSDEERTIANVAAMVGRYFGRAVEVVPGPLAAGGTLRRCPDVSKLAALGFRARTPLDQGLPYLLAWYDAHADMEPARAETKRD